MTEAMRRQITELRLKGLGYKSIGIVVGTSKENVRYYCKAHGLGGTAAEAKERYKEQRKSPENCKQCGCKLE